MQSLSFKNTIFRIDGNYFIDARAYHIKDAKAWLISRALSMFCTHRSVVLKLETCFEAHCILSFLYYRIICVYIHVSQNFVQFNLLIPL